MSANGQRYLIPVKKTSTGIALSGCLSGMKSSFRNPQIIRSAFLALAAIMVCPCGPAVAAAVPDSVTVKESVRKLWDFEVDREGWTAQNAITGLAANKGCLRGTANAGDPYVFYNSTPFAVKGSAGVAVRVWLSAAGPLELFWTNEDGGSSGVRRVEQQVPAQQWTTIRFDLSANPEWVGKTISGLRLDPGASGTSFAVDYVALVEHLAVPSSTFVAQTLDFESGLAGWTANGHVTGFLSEEGKLKGKSSGADPNVNSPTISQPDQGGVWLQLKLTKDSSCQLFWETTEGGFTETRSKKFNVIGAAGWQSVRLDLREHPAWKGKTITRLRLDPCSVAGDFFEIDSIIVLGKEAFADTDGDWLVGAEELVHNTDPAQASQILGRLTHERWNGAAFYSTREMVGDKKFVGQPDAVCWTGLNQLPSFYQVNYFATRSRGYITAPVTGYYRFWISGASGVELNLSENGSKYGKRRIAELNPEISTGYGVGITSSNRYDNYASQMSEDIYLVAGSKYFIEAIQTTGHTGNCHMSIAWASPGGVRVDLPSGVVESYAPTSDDNEDDYLPDAWEVLYGLNPLDNGFADIAKQGERGDFDSDGLSNREEFLLGTNPANADTDADGISDFTEVRISNTDVLVSNAASSTIVSTVDILNHQGSNLNWTSTGNGIVGDQFRGWVEWDFTVPQNGIWILDLETALRGTIRLGDTIGFDPTIDGVDTGRRNLTYGPGAKNTLRLVTPYLAQGTHRLRINIDNMIARRMVEILALNVLSPGGPDIDNDGMVDWIESILSGSDHVNSHSLLSKTSPFCLEGHSMVVPAVVLNGAGVTLGVDDNHWFKNLNLDPAQTTTYTASFASGVVQAGNITWETTNVLTSTALTIRAGDTLKLGANFTTGTGAATITIGAQGYSVTGSGTALHTFGTKGSYTVTASRSGATSKSFSVTVRAAAFSNLPAMVDNALAIWTLNKSLVDPALTLKPGKGLRLGKYTNISSTNYSHTLYPSMGGRLAVAARIGETGPIVGLAQFNVTGFSDALQNDLTFSYDSGIEGYYTVTTPVVFTDLPPGGSIVVSIFRSGVMFRDGSTTMTFTQANLSNGILNLEFLFPNGMSGGYCHYVSIYDASGNLISKR